MTRPSTTRPSTRAGPQLVSEVSGLLFFIFKKLINEGGKLKKHRNFCIFSLFMCL
jgi:hypothetical protein